MEFLTKFINIFIVIILYVKISYVICVFVEYYLKYRQKDTNVSIWIKWKDVFHSTYSTMMSILLILLFSQILHKGPVVVDEHTKTFLTTFGVLSLFDYLHITQWTKNIGLHGIWVLQNCILAGRCCFNVGVSQNIRIWKALNMFKSKVGL